MNTNYQFTKDISGVASNGVYPCNVNYSANLSAATVTTLTLPKTEKESSQWNVVFVNKTSTILWVTFDGTTPQVPVAATFTATTSVPDPIDVRVPGETVIKVISDGAIQLGVSLYEYTR